MTGAVCFAAGWFVGGRRPPAPPPSVEAAAPSVPRRAAPPSATGPLAATERVAGESPVLAAYPPGKGVRLALVIDDLGRSVEEVATLERLPVPVSYSVLPFESRTAEVVAELQRLGAEILCHLPMEPSNGANPGPGALTLEMGSRQLAEATRWALAAVEPAVGVNNHMGSTFTSDQKAMKVVLEAVGERDLFYLDSRTSPESVGYSLAVEMGIAASERQVFLDPEGDAGAIRAQFERWLEVGRERGAAIAIGHPRPATLEVLAAELPRALAAGYEFVPVSYLLDRPHDGLR